jgi:hypothetical protein
LFGFFSVPVEHVGPPACSVPLNDRRTAAMAAAQINGWLFRFISFSS